jgi:hypothetical protein
MRRFMGWASAAVLAVALAGCAGAGMGSTGSSCEGCSYSYAPSGKQTIRKAVCIKDGKVFDCSKNPPECPECAAKAAQNK